MTNGEFEMTSTEGDAAMVAVAAGHPSRRDWYKDVRNSWFQRLASILRPILNPLNPLIPVIPLQSAGAPDHHRLWVGPCGPTRTISKTRVMRWSKIITAFKYITCRSARLEKRVPVASRRVLVASKCVGVASEDVRVVSRQVPMRSKHIRMAGKTPGLDNRPGRAYPVIGTL